MHIRDLRESIAELKTLLSTPSPAIPPETKPKRPEIKRDRKAESRIADGMAETFSQGELSEFALDMGLDYEAILGEGLKGKILGMVSHFARHGHMELFVNQLETERPHVLWHTMLLDTSELT